MLGGKNMYPEFYIQQPSYWSPYSTYWQPTPTFLYSYNPSLCFQRCMMYTGGNYNACKSICTPHPM